MTIHTPAVAAPPDNASDGTAPAAATLSAGPWDGEACIHRTVKHHIVKTILRAFVNCDLLYATPSKDIPTLCWHPGLDWVKVQIAETAAVLGSAMRCRHQVLDERDLGYRVRLR